MFSIFVSFAFRVIFWPGLIAAIVIEMVALTWLLNWNWRRAGLVSITINFASLFVGLFTYPIMAGLLEILTRSLFPTDTEIVGHLVFFGFVALGYSLADTAIELPMLKGIFEAPLTWNAAAGIFIANLVSTGVLVSLPIVDDLVIDKIGNRISDSEIGLLEIQYADEIEFMHNQIAEIAASEHSPWRDTDWTARQRQAAQEFRFLWLELRNSNHDRLTLVPMTGFSLSFYARRENENRIIFRDEKGGQVFYRYSLSDVEKPWLQAIADFRPID